MLSSRSELKAAVAESTVLKAAFQVELGAFVKHQWVMELAVVFTVLYARHPSHVGLGVGRYVHRSRGGGRVLAAWFYGFRGDANSYPEGFLLGQAASRFVNSAIEVSLAETALATRVTRLCVSVMVRPWAD